MKTETPTLGQDRQRGQVHGKTKRCSCSVWNMLCACSGDSFSLSPCTKARFPSSEPTSVPWPTYSLGQGNSGFSYKQTDCRKGLRGGKDDFLEKVTSYTREVQGSTSGTLKELLHWGAFFPFCGTVAEETPPEVRMQAVEEVRQPRQSWLCQPKRNNIVQIKKKKIKKKTNQ